MVLAIILMILITYSSLLGLFDPMAKETPNFATLKSSSGTRTNDSEVNDHVLSEGCDVGSEILLISCGDIELNPGPTFPCPTCNVMFVTQKLLIVHEKRIHDKREMKCDQCDKILIGNNNLKNHKKSHKSTACKHCGIWLKVNSKLAHEKNVQGTQLSIHVNFAITLLTKSLILNAILGQLIRQVLPLKMFLLITNKFQKEQAT